LASHRIAEVTPLLDVRIHGLGGASVAEPAALDPVRRAEVTEVTDSLPGEVHFFVRNRSRQLDDLEREACGGGSRVGEHVDGTGGGLSQDFTLEIRSDAGLTGIGEEGSHLDAGGAALERLHQLVGRTSASSEPEGKTELAELLEVHLVALGIDRLTALVQA